MNEILGYIVPAYIFSIAGGFNVNFQTSVAIMVDTVHHGFFGVLYSAIATAVTCKLRFPSINLADCAYKTQK